MSKKNVTVDLSSDEVFENKEKIEILRSEDNQISGYNFVIQLRDKEPLQGDLTREEMELIYRLYSSEGANLTQRTVSRYFPIYTLAEFKKILRAFGITKANAPFAPHQLEEFSPEKLGELNIKAKESDYLRRFEQDRSKLFENKYKETLKTFANYKNSVAEFTDIISGFKIESNIVANVPEISNDKELMIYLSDMHIGAHVSHHSLYDNMYNEQVVHERMQKVYDHITTLAANYNITNINILNVGDSLDGMNAQTTRGGHALPQNLDNKDQFKVYFNVMLDLFKNLSQCGLFNKIRYFCVGSDNHSGDFGYITNKALEAALNQLNPNIETKIFDKIMDHFTVGNRTIIMHHGKDSRDMFRNMPLVINEKTENYINQYIIHHKITGKITFVKGDLHMSAKTYAKLFDYKSVGSFFGGSEWIHANFGINTPVVDIDIFDKDQALETRLELN